MFRHALTTIAGEPASRLGLAAYPDQQEACARTAFRGGVNYFFFYSIGQQSVIRGLRPLLRRSREQIIVATGTGSRNRKGLDRVRRQLGRAVGLETLDVFFAEYVEAHANPREIFGRDGVLAVLAEWKAAGLIRYAGATTHDRGLARRLIDSGQIDVLMLRFNMAHRKAADAVFPAARRAGVPIIAFTATRWRTLLAGHPDWDQPAPTATDCYRYCLSQPAVRIVLTAPSTTRQARESLTALATRPFGRRQTAAWNAYGDLVYGDGHGRFETEWP
jgi:predicted aldo/keto reductase-like oxidoreductase